MNADSSSPAFLIYDIDGYEYDYTYRNTNTNANRIAPLLVKEWGGTGYNAGYRWRYMGANSTSTTELDNGDNIYVVYKKKANVTTGGTPSVDQTETWPDQEDPARKPQFGKSSTNNGNGTNNISLSITGPESLSRRARLRTSSSCSTCPAVWLTICPAVRLRMFLLRNRELRMQKLRLIRWQILC